MALSGVPNRGKERTEEERPAYQSTRGSPELART